IETTVTITTNEWREVADVVMALDPDLPKVRCLPGELQQAFLNIIVNAAHAIAAARHDTDPKGTINIKTSAADGQVEIRIDDTGTGIQEEHRGKIFDPFFTTKEVGKGT